MAEAAQAAGQEASVASGVTGLERAYFGVITLAALFVAYLGFAIPARMDESFTWADLPPLHARFVAALYLFGAVYMGCCTIARHRSQITPGPPAVIIFTAFLLLVTLLNLDAFDFDLVPVWVWTGSYVVYPLLGVALVLWTRGRPRAEVPGPPLAAGRGLLLTLAVVYGLTGALLLVARELMVDVWPWPITNGLAQFYAGPFLAIAYCCWRYSTRRTVVEVAPLALALLVFSVAAVAVSLRHRSLFSTSDAASWVWFGWFGLGAVAAAWLVARIASARQT